MSKTSDDLLFASGTRHYSVVVSSEICVILTVTDQLSRSIGPRMQRLFIILKTRLDQHG